MKGVVSMQGVGMSVLKGMGSLLGLAPKDDDDFGFALGDSGKKSDASPLATNLGGNKAANISDESMSGELQKAIKGVGTTVYASC